MKHKTFKLEQGKLVYIDTREAKEGDIIVTGETSMANLSEVQLREGTEDIGDRIANLAKAQAIEKSKTADIRKDVDKVVAATKAKTAAINRANPTLQAEQTAKLEASIRRAHPEYTDKQVRTFIKGR